MTVLSALAIGAFSVFLLIVKRYRYWRDVNPLGLPYPPGPKPWPIVGNYFQVPAQHPWFTYTEWGRQYGDIIYTRLLTEDVIIINSAKIANDLLESRSNIYSSRPPFHMLNLMGFGFLLVLMPYGSEWRTYRRLFHQVFRADNIVDYFPAMAEKSRELLVRLLHRPDDFMKHVQHFAASDMMLILYGYKMVEEDDRFLRLVEKAIKVIADFTLPGASVVDLVPDVTKLPSWLPGMQFKSYAASCLGLATEMRNEPFNFAKSNMVSGSGMKCIASQLLGRLPSRNDTHPLEEVIKGVAGVGYTAGADTTAGAIDTFFLAMSLCPDVQRKAQEEIDRIVGTSRLPEFDDRRLLPYVEAVLWEVLRWRAVTPLGVSHATTEADTYDGYFIPKGATIVMNTWAIHMDERVYDEPEKFKPERFLNPDGTIRGDAYPRTAFGMGRRICPGRHFVDAVAWIVMARVLATFDVLKSKDQPDGDVPYTNGVAIRLTPFKCSIVPRNSGVKELIL
ncbi:cytochrome P450 [Neolentinus lepideus HHB14362 ss-1]|uniref:Cytochrome P450 n=1 Tax=Neolentinus lepideus HHB14362 ss-1 TaxID=1314782 RepID=A0A165QKS5_9AGAM|nr:cytochrome P450 [Neolentinus lepideus HHB14362 ss-1]